MRKVRATRPFRTVDFPLRASVRDGRGIGAAAGSLTTPTQPQFRAWLARQQVHRLDLGNEVVPFTRERRTATDEH